MVGDTYQLQKILKATQVKRLDFDLLMENVIDYNPSKVNSSNPLRLIESK